MQRKAVTVCLILFVCLIAHAKLVITKTTCNYQSGRMAVVDEGTIRVGWQYEDFDRWPLTQNVYQIEIHERVTGKLVYDSGVVHSSESQFITLPHLAPNQYGYNWRVRIGYENKDKEDEKREQL